MSEHNKKVWDYYTEDRKSRSQHEYETEWDVFKDMSTIFTIHAIECMVSDIGEKSYNVLTTYIDKTTNEHIYENYWVMEVLS